MELVFNFYFVLFREDWRNVGNLQCDISCSILWFLSMNASGHLVGLAVDRVLILSDTIWHHSITWRRKIPLISLGMSLFHIILLVPRNFFSNVKKGNCQMDPDYVFAKMYRALLVTIFSTFSHFSAVFVATILFIQKLRKRCASQTSLNLHDNELARENEEAKNALLLTKEQRPDETLDAEASGEAEQMGLSAQDNQGEKFF